MRIAAIHLAELPLERVFGAAASKAVRAVRRLSGGRSVLSAVSPRARVGGVREGMTVVEARARLPSLELRDADPAGERQLLSSAAEVMLGFSPTVEIVEPALILLELGASRAWLTSQGLNDEPSIVRAIVERLAQIGHVAHVALADDADTARTLVEHLTRQERSIAVTPRRSRSKGAPPIHTLISAPGEAAASLAALPLPALSWTDLQSDHDGKLAIRLETAVASLRLLGVREIGHLARFPADQVASRFGDAGAVLMARARGERRRPLRVFEPEPTLQERFELEGATSDLEPILFVLKRLLDRLEARLVARGLAASGLELRFLLDLSHRTERIRVSTARPSRSARSLLRLCRERLDGALPDAIREITIEALAPVSDHGAQLDLFREHAERIEKVEALIARLEANLGEQAVFSAQLQDTHRPEAAWSAKPFAIEAAFEEPALPLRRRTQEIVARSALARSRPREAYALPETGEALVVLGAVDDSSAAVEAPSGAAPKSTRGAASWPAPVKRKKEDEPLPPLPPRPLELLAVPEPARLAERRLFWRGQTHAVRDLGRRERMECEWWRSAPLLREYLVIELEDGRRLWAFFSLGSEEGLWVHGVFD
ncbi:MAG: DNA polymerase Y family protein [Deltaproteobacteria bacterium]|nr:DNA polymerase Y family protein [Deltaproteobacteria bacterium]